MQTYSVDHNISNDRSFFCISQHFIHCAISSPQLNSDSVPIYAVVNKNKTKKSESSTAATSVSHSTSAMNCVAVYMCGTTVAYYIYTRVCTVSSVDLGEGSGVAAL